MHVDFGKVRGVDASSLHPDTSTRRFMMRCASWPAVAIRSANDRGWLVFVCGILAASVAPGCGHEAKIDFTTVSKPPTVQVINPPVRNIVRVVGQPSFIEAYERTSIFPKPSAYIEKWNVDIGDKVKKGDVLATLFVPELVEDHGTKTAIVSLDKQRIELALKVVKVAEADVQASEARLKEAKAILDKYEAEVERWDSEVRRLKNEVDRGVVDPQVLLESNNQLKSSKASRDAAKASIMKADADLLSSRAELEKATVDVSVARADLSVAESEAKRMKAWVDYLTLSAPFDGVIVAQRQHVRLRITQHGRSHCHAALAAPLSLGCRADLCGGPH